MCIYIINKLYIQPTHAMCNCTIAMHGLMNHVIAMVCQIAACTPIFFVFLYFPTCATLHTFGMLGWGVRTSPHQNGCGFGPNQAMPGGMWIGGCCCAPHTRAARAQKRTVLGP